MKNRKLIKTVAASIVCSAMALTAFGFAACNSDGNGEGDGETPHYHTYSTGDEWAYDGTNHWRYATCGHDDLISNKAAHSWDGDTCSVCKAPKPIIKPTLTEDDDNDPIPDEEGNIDVLYSINASDFEAVTCTQDIVSGIYTLKSGTMLRSKTPANLYSYDETNGKQLISAVTYDTSIRIGAATDIIEINAPEAGTFVMHVGNGSGSALKNQLWLTKPDGTQESLSYYAEGSSGPCVEVEIKFDKAGKYRITRQGGTSDIYYMSYTAKVKDSPVKSIGVASVGKSNYFVGQKFGIDGLAVNATTETGRISPIQTGRLLIDYSAFNNTKSGTYEILVSYSKAGHTYETSYYVNVYSFEDLTLGTDKIVKESTNTSAGNGVYANHSLRQFYFTGETLSTDGISVILNGMINGKMQDFLLEENDYKVSTVDMSVAGKKQVTVSYTTGGTTKSKTFDIIVADKDSALATATEVNVNVNAATTDASVGVKNGEGVYQFQTIHQALDFLNNAGLSKTAKKTMTLAAGTYWEKLEITVPNLTIEGAGKDSTKIEYDALYGIKDASGFEHTTDSTATLNVREAAENFTIKNVTVSNYYNSLEHFDEKLGAGYGEHRALALLVQSDKFTMDTCNLLGYQDTVEFFTGRQFIVNSYIAGTTDFIFGTNNTTYFYNCEIHSITNGKTDGGYITAFKGNNKDGNDAITYGAIFDKCHFTADTDVVENGNTALGRPWGAYAAVAVINSEIDGHVSKTTSDFVKNQRYVAMSGVKPTDSTVKFAEYNNTGDGAIDTAVGGMTMLTAAEAKNYNDLSVIFGTTNGGVKYSSAWAPIMPGVETHEVTVYTDGGIVLGTLTVEGGKTVSEDQIKELVAGNAAYANHDIVGVYSDDICETEYTYPEISADGNIYVKLFFDETFSTNSTISFGTSGNYKGYLNNKLIVNAEGQIKDNGGDNCEIGEGTEFTIKVKAGATVTVSSYKDGYTYYSVKIDGVLNEEIGVQTGTSFKYNATADCEITFVGGRNPENGKSNYFHSISISYGLTEITTDMTFNNVSSVDSTEYIEFDGVSVHSGGYWNLGKTGTIKIKVSAGATITIKCSYWGNGIAINGVDQGPLTDNTPIVYNATEGGEITIGCLDSAQNVSYIQSIAVSY